MLNSDLDTFKKSLKVERTVEETGALDITIEQIIELLEIIGIVPKHAEELEVYYEDSKRSIPMEEYLAIRW